MSLALAGGFLTTESENCLVVSSCLRPHGLYSPWNSPGQNTGVGNLSFLQGLFPDPEIEPGSPALQADSLLSEPPGKQEMKVVQLCLTLCDPMDYTAHGILQARILEWVAFSFSRRSSQPRDRAQVSGIAGGFFTR